MKGRVAILLLLLCCAEGASAQTYLGDYSSHEIVGKAVTVHAGQAAVRFMFYRPEIIRVDFLPTPSAAPDSSLVVIRDTTEWVAFTCAATDSSIEIASSSLTVVCRKRPLRISYFDCAGKLLLAEPASGGLSTSEAGRQASFEIGPSVHFYGTGERGTSLDRLGKAFDSYNAQIGGYTYPLPTMNVNVPFLASTGGYALYFENTYPGRFDLGVSDESKFSYRATGGELSYFLVAAPRVPEQLEKYTWLTGRQPLPPRWAFGYIQSKYGYRDESEARALVTAMRQKGIPCDAIVLDLYWFNAMGDISWNLVRWPDPSRMMSDFLSQGVRTIVITEPYITEQSVNFGTAAANGYLAKTASGEPYLLSNWWSCGCRAGLLDLTSPAVQEWWWSKHPAFFGSELAGLWTDLGEPERHPSDMQHFLGSAPKVHNVYNLIWAKTIYEGFGKFRPNQRLFNLTRSGYAGIQRYGAILWSGDVGKDFGGLAVQLPMLLTMGMSGLAYHNSDIGGFSGGQTTPELYVRWMQYGTFCPIARAHGVGQPTEPWGYGPEAEMISRKFIELRYRLLPYIYTMAYQDYATGLPLARPLLFEEPDNNALLNESSSYLWGSSLLVSPVVQSGQTTKTLYLPRGKWFDYWTDEVYDGGRTATVAAPLDRMPLFVRAGSIIPMAPVMNYSDERPLDTLMLAVYPSKGRDAHFTLYEDDGKTLAYQSGGYALTPMLQSSADSAGRTSINLSIGPAQGSYTGRVLRRVYVSEIHGISSKPTDVLQNGRILLGYPSYVLLRQSVGGFFYDDSAKLLCIQSTTDVDSLLLISAEGVRLTSRAEDPAEPGEFRLDQNYPNPFNMQTMIRFSVPGSGMSVRSDIELKVYDVLGREVAVVTRAGLGPGEHSLPFESKGLTSGVYFYVLATGSRFVVKKMVLAK